MDIRFPLIAILVSTLAMSAIAAFVLSFYPLYFRSVQVAEDSANEYSHSAEANAESAVISLFGTAALSLDLMDGHATAGQFLTSVSVQEQMYWMVQSSLDPVMPLWLVHSDGTAIKVGNEPWVFGAPTVSTGSLNYSDSLFVSVLYGSNGTCAAQLWRTVPRGSVGPIAGTNSSSAAPATFNATGGSIEWYNFSASVAGGPTWIGPLLPQPGTNSSSLRFMLANRQVDGTAYAVEVLESHLSQKLRHVTMTPSGRLLVFHAATQLIFGSNFIDSMGVPEQLYLSDLLPNSGYVMTAHDTFFSDVLSAVGVSQFVTCDAPCSLDYGSGFDRLFVSVFNEETRIHLPLRLIVVARAIDFMTEIKAAHGVGLAITLPSVAAITILLSVLIWVAMLPLKRLEESMLCGKIGEESVAQGGRSIIAEICSIEDAYRKLQADLKKVKSFLPQAVLKQLEGDTDDDDDEGAVMVTSVLSGGSTSIQQAEMSMSGAPGSPMTSASGARGSLTGGSSLALKQSTRSRDSSGSKGRRAADAVALASKRVTIVVININGFHDVMRASGVAAMVALHSKWMRSIEEHVGKNRGVLESFSGDRFLVSFNASKQCASHYSAAAALITQLTALSEGASGGGFQGLSIGCSSGAAQCGHMGTDNIKGYAIVGAVMSNAYALMRYARRTNAASLACPEATAGMKYEYSLMPLDVVVLPGQLSTTGAVVVSTVVRKKQANADEWMYELHESEAGESAEKLMEECFAAYLSGQTVLLNAKLSSLLTSCPDLECAKALSKHKDVPVLEYAAVL